MKKILSVLTLTLLIIMNLTACDFGKDSGVSRDIVSKANVNVEETSDLSEDITDASNNSASSSGEYVFPDTIVVYTCIGSDEKISVKDINTEGYDLIDFESMVVNGKMIEKGTASVNKDVKRYDAPAINVKCDYDDEKVTIRIEEVNGAYVGQILDKTQEFNYYDSEHSDYASILIESEDVIEPDDCLTVLSAFKFMDGADADGFKHAHILPVVN